MLRGGKYTRRKSAGWPRQPIRTHRRDTSIFYELKDALSTRTSIRTERRKWRQLHRTLPYPAFCLTSDESIGNWVSVAFYSRKSRFASLPNRIPHGIGYPSSIIAPTLTSQISATTWRLLEGRSRDDRGKEIRVFVGHICNGLRL